MKRKKSKTNRVYIKGILLDKFKAFGKSSEIELSPMVNLIFGKNSSGKSSILQGLRLIRQSYAKEQLTPFNLESPEKYKDNGGIDIDIKYKGIITDNNERENLTLGIKTGILSYDKKTKLDSDKQIIYEYRHDNNFYKEDDQLIKERVLLKSLKVKNDVTKVEFKLDFNKAEIFDEASDIAWNFADKNKYPDGDKRAKDDFKDDAENYRSLYSPYYYNIKLEYIKISRIFELFKKFKKNKKNILDYLKTTLETFKNSNNLDFKKIDFKSLNEPMKQLEKIRSSNQNKKTKIDQLRKLADASARFFILRSLNFGLREYSKSEVDEIINVVQDFISVASKQINYKTFENLIISDCRKRIERLCYYRGKFYLNPEKSYDPFRVEKKFSTVEDRGSIEDRILYLYDFITEGHNYYARGLRDKPEAFLQILRSFVEEDKESISPNPTAYNDINICMNKMYIIPGLRSMPKRYFAKGIQTSYVGARAEYLAESLAKPEVKKATNYWLNKLEIPYSVEVINVENHYEIIWKPQNKKINIFSNHIGLGYPLILPFIVQCLTATNKIIVVEEPEVHLHPKLQADLGDLIINSAKNNNNQIILETHSEDLLLRVLKKVRDKEIQPDLISANYILKKGNKPSEIKKIKINSDGQYFTPWKDDIFAERLKELG